MDNFKFDDDDTSLLNEEENEPLDRKAIADMMNALDTENDMGKTFLH